MTGKGRDRVLGLHPSSRGFGWILFEAADSPFDWGAADIRVGGNDEVLRRVGVLFRKYHPTVLTLEEFDGAGSRRSPRIQALYRLIIRAAECRRIKVWVYPRTKLSDVFPGARTRQQIAAAIAQRLAPLRHRLPKPRRIWDSERSNMALFAAAACALAYFAALHHET